MDIDQHVRELLKSMSEGVYEKEHILAMSLLSAVAGESIFLLGPPGTAKSLVARRLKMIFKDGRAFEYLMSRFSTPDEIFGPVSISLLKSEDRYERVVDGFLPTATVVFLDEIWKAGPSIQNALLTAINERIFQNGRTTLKLPMKALIAASNELPAEGEGLEALWDRFLVRMVSNCIQSESIFYKMIRQKNLKSNHVPDYLLISDELYDKWQQGIEEIEISNEICSIITNIRKRLKAEIKKDEVEEMDYYISDRRWKKCVHLLQSSAFLNGRKQIDLTDIPILIHCLWNKSETIPTIIDIVCSSITSPIDAKVVKYGKDIDQALNCIRKKPASSNSQEIDEDDSVQVNFFYYNILKYHTGKTLFYKMDYRHVPTKQTCDGILYYDETKQAHIIHAIYTGQLYDYKIKNTKEAKRIKLSKCHGGIIIDNVPYAFQTKKTNAEPSIFNMPGSPSPNMALAALEEIRNSLFTKLSDLQRLFNDYRNLFLSDDDMKIVSRYLALCEKNLKEMEVKAQNAVMTKDEDISQRLTAYDEAFDFYMDRGRMPDAVPPNDLLGGFMQQAIQENPQLDSQDPLWKDIMKEEILKFIEAMLKLFEPAEKQYQKEKTLIRVFSLGGIEKKRELWPKVYGTIKQQYKLEEVNIDGYVQQFKESAPESVFGPLIRDWDTACDNQLKEYEAACIEKNKTYWEQSIREHGNTDYKERKKIQKMFYSYPQMVEIVNMIGREKPQREDEKDETIRRYLPLLPSPPTPAVEVEEITNGNNLQHLLPIETAILADHQTESLFYYKYAMSQLQLFANKPKIETKMKVEQSKKKEPRLEKGPIIVSIDTSGSMCGRPIELAICLLRQLLQMAKKQKRKCFLISFSVRAQSIDLSKPGSWKKLDSFLSDYYSGGTDGNEMLKAGIKMLNSEKYAMADMLIISDFIFDPPNDRVSQFMQEERQKGTRFYGLQIGRDSHVYDTILDKVWQIRN